MRTTFLATGLLLLCSYLGFSQKQQKKIAGNYTFETECLGVEQDGSQTLKAWGTGRNRGDAVEQAKKNAVRDVLFKGIMKGKTECNKKPLIFEVNAQENHEDYFNQFFADGGAYAKFVSMEDESLKAAIFKDKKKAKGTGEVSEGVVVRVLRPELKKKMMEDKIIESPTIENTKKSIKLEY